MADSCLFKVEIQEGRGFGPEVQALACTATFAGEPKTTPFSVGRDAHTWNVALQWRVGKQALRRLATTGQNTCKVVVSRKDGAKVGWFVLDLRSAKLHHQYKADEGGCGAVVVMGSEHEVGSGSGSA